MCPDFPNRLLADPESTVTLGRPSTGSKFLNRMAMLDVTWYETQLDRMARGLPPDPNLGAWPAVFQMLGRAGAYALLPRRA